MYSFDVETRSLDPSMVEHAGLEPWRVRQGKAEISSAAICRPDGTVHQIINDGIHKNIFINNLTAMMDEMAGKVVYAHFAIFDIAWVIATLQPDRMGDIPPCVKKIFWRDTALLTRWLINGQVAEACNFSYSLSNLVKTFLPNDPLTPDFVKMKEQNVVTGDDSGYWEERGELDVIMTHKLATLLQPKIAESQRIGFLIEMAGLVPIANSWIMGLRINQPLLDIVERNYDNQFQQIISTLGIVASEISSPKQLANLLFNKWGFKPHSYTPSGGPSTAKDDLKWIQYSLLQNNLPDEAEKLGLLITAKNISTLKSKYVKTTREALAHTKDGYIYGTPRVFGTYTGRMTYSNSTLKKYKTGIALHQMPRKAKQIRELIIAPDGYDIYEADAAGQESRLMALRSGDPVMIQVFANGLNFHSMTGASIIGMEYEEFEKNRKAENDSGYLTEQRQLGKLTNLACNFRIGGKSLSEKSFVEYDTFMTIATGNFLVQTFNRTYKGVPEYWDEVVQFAKQHGYVESFGGRRFKIHEWGSRSWQSESSAINVPIQGSGASMKEIAIVETYIGEPRAKFLLDLHDASFFYVPSDQATEINANLDRILNNIDYEPYWGFKPVIPLPYESKNGKSFADVK